jgi:hypothetical protein
MDTMEKIAQAYGSREITTREQAIFEVGIKLATIFHQFVGTPIQNDPHILQEISHGIKAAILCQPYVSKVDIEIRPRGYDEHPIGKQHVYDYTVISGRNLIAEVEIHYHEWLVMGRVEWIEDLAYPLMYVKTIQKI